MYNDYNGYGMNGMNGMYPQEEDNRKPLEKYGFDLVLDLADRNRGICDEMTPEGTRESRSQNLPRNLSDMDTYRAIAKLQHKKVETVAKAAGPNVDRGVLWAGKAYRGTVLGIDIETTSTSPDRGRIINVGWEIMDLSLGAEPRDAGSAFCGLPFRIASWNASLVAYIVSPLCDYYTTFRGFCKHINTQ